MIACSNCGLPIEGVVAKILTPAEASIMCSIFDVIFPHAASDYRHAEQGDPGA